MYRENARIRNSSSHLDVDSCARGAPCWRDASFGLPKPVPPYVRAWILLDTSMTRALQQTFGPEMSVQVVHDSSGSLLADERTLLNTTDQAGHVREVVLWCGRQSRLVARTVYVSSKLRAHQELNSLGSRPLGELLFARDTPRWLKREFTVIEAHMALFALVRRAPGTADTPCWARRTVFLLEHEHLLVTEIFLPAMFSQGCVAPPNDLLSGDES